jgi:molybdenum cofactor guanylyltransferase
MIDAAILAGGRARRLGGRDKSQLRAGGRTILERQVDALTPIVDRIWLSGYREAVPCGLPVTIIPDRVPDSGPLGGIDAALEAANGRPLLLLACDLPNVTTPFLQYLISQLSGADAVVPRTERGYHPLCAAYAASCRVPVRQRLDAGLLRVQDLLGELTVRVMDTRELAPFGGANHLLANVNTQVDLDALESQQNH